MVDTGQVRNRDFFNDNKDLRLIRQEFLKEKVLINQGIANGSQCRS